MKFYEKLSAISFLKKSYAFKFLFVAFIGIHIPLIGILLFVLFDKGDFSVAGLLVFPLVMTLIATGGTLWILKKLIQPIELAPKALSDYKLNRTITNLPVYFSDEAGLLLFNIHDSILESESFITEKQDLIYLLSHDLKTFAGNPKSLATLILETNPSDEVKELAQLICESSTEQYQYIQNFIQMLKKQDEMLQTNPDFKLVDLENIIQVVENKVFKCMNAKRIQLVKKLDLKMLQLVINPELLTRVIYNLMSNAVKFSFFDSVIEIQSFQDEKGLYIKVIDKGVGFDSESSQKYLINLLK
ncbi:sensor histidine kinase [Flavobacterium daejeonense]|uniref:sensor histidine kinase n=1 Tax=Flavobacterium daejeonense TaxID=350893 RepID=UPI000A5E025A|nr:HAMP domain-containing sensor histidine kinase [Flavobacterium daejeonense]